MVAMQPSFSSFEREQQIAMIVSGIATVHAPTIALARPSGDGVSAIYDGFERLRSMLDEANPDLVIVFTTEHIVNIRRNLVPGFTVGIGESHEIVQEFGLPDDKVIPGAPATATDLVDYAFANNFDVAHSAHLRLDHGTVIPLNYLVPDYDIPILPVVINATFPPFPSLRRSYDFGRMIGRFIDDRLAGQRVALVATGGIVHSVGQKPSALDYDFDERFVSAISEGDLDEILEIEQDDLDKLGNGTNEIRCWLALAAALGDGWQAKRVTSEAGQGPMMGMYQLQWDRQLEQVRKV